MKYTTSSIELQRFFPEDLIVTRVEDNDSSVDIYLKSQSRQCFCPKCFSELTEKRGTYTRTVQDLPILGKNTFFMFCATASHKSESDHAVSVKGDGKRHNSEHHPSGKIMN